MTGRPDEEMARIRGVYGDYRKSSSVARRWDPSSFGNQAILAERREAVKRLLDSSGATPLDEKRILDVGCGSGGTLGEWIALGARSENLFGVDLLLDRLGEAVLSSGSGLISCADARALPFPDDTFDLVSAFTLFSSVLDPKIAAQVAAELRRVCGRDGWLLWYDLRYPSPRNRNVRSLARRHISALFPNAQIRLASITVLPPLARRLRPSTAKLYGRLAKVPVLRSHYLGLIRFLPTSLPEVR